MEKPVISIIIPFYNEETCLETLVLSISNYCKQHDEFCFEVVLVDDGSKDNSFALLSSLNHSGYHAKIVRLARNFGSHNALRAGLLNATGDYVTFLYADLQDPLDIVHKLYAKCAEGLDIVWAYREATEQGFIVGFFSKFYSWLIRKWAVQDYPANGCDVPMFTRKIAKLINESIETNSSIILQIFSLGFNQGRILYRKAARQQGASKWTLQKKMKLFIDSFVNFSFAPIRFVTVMGVSFFFIGILWSGYLIVRILLRHDPRPGWPALVSILMLGFGITNISLGILAEYIWRILDVARRRPAFVVDTVLQLT